MGRPLSESEREHDLAESAASLEVVEGAAELRDGKYAINGRPELVLFQRPSQRFKIASASRRCDQRDSGRAQWPGRGSSG
jgi:hypothetical protein